MSIIAVDFQETNKSQFKRGKMKVIACDLDGVLDIPDNREKLNLLFEDKNNFIVVHTARSYSIFHETRELLHKLGVKYHALVMEKIRADVYFDDKNATL